MSGHGAIVIIGAATRRAVSGSTRGAGRARDVHLVCEEPEIRITPAALENVSEESTTQLQLHRRRPGTRTPALRCTVRSGGEIDRASVSSASLGAVLPYGRWCSHRCARAKAASPAESLSNVAVGFSCRRVRCAAC